MKKLLIGGAVLALAVPALAQVAPIPATQTPHSMKVQTRTDVQAKVAKHFARMDTNRDGFVTKAEADAAAQAFRGKRAEGRGKHDAQWHEQAFERLDANRDGAITRAEWDAAQAQRQQRMADRGGDGQPARARMMHGGMGSFGGHMFEVADANHDGRVSLQEAQAAALQHFDMVDTNRDGRITPDERMQMHQRMQASHQHG